MSRLKIGFVGVGGMGQCAHLKNYALLPDCEVVALAELKTEQARLVAARYGIPRVYKDHNEMLAGETLDGIVASQPFDRHGVLVPELLKAGIPVFTEKPLARSVEAGERILKALATSGAKLMIGYHKRSDPATMYARKMMDEFRQTGEMGPMRYIRITMPAGDWVAAGFDGCINTGEKLDPLPEDPPPSDMDKATADQYGGFVNYYIHQVNMMHHLMGERYRVSYADPAGMTMTVHGESGLTGVIELSPYTTNMDWQESMLICYEKGYIKVELPAPLASNRAGRVEICRGYPNGDSPPTFTFPVLPWIHAMRQQAINFLRVIRGEIEPPCDAAEALEDLKVAREYIFMMRDAKKG